MPQSNASNCPAESSSGSSSWQMETVLSTITGSRVWPCPVVPFPRVSNIKLARIGDGSFRGASRGKEVLADVLKVNLPEKPKAKNNASSR